MKLLSLLLIALTVCSGYALEPLPPSPPLDIKPGTYLLVTQGQINDQLLSLAQQESVSISRSTDGGLVMTYSRSEESRIEVEDGKFLIIRKSKGRENEGIWVSTYMGSLSSREPRVYSGNFVSISRTDSYSGFDRGFFMLVHQKTE